MTRVHFFCALLCFSGSLAWPSLGKSSENDGVVFCYYGEWANTRPGAGRFGVSDIPTDLCTHIVYSFLTLDGPTGNLIIPLESTHEEKSNSVADLIALKRSNANLKILAAIGGWVEGSDNFSPQLLAMTRVLFLCALLCFGGSLAWPSLWKSSENDGVVFCYYGEWANTRPGAGRFGVSDLPTDLCTHIVYSFLTLDGPTGNLIFPLESTHEEKSNSVADLIALKRSNANLKILAAIGGWVEGSDNFSPVVNNDTLRATFIRNLYDYIDTNCFDGLDLDWEYPAQRGGLESDKEKFILLVKELKEAFTPKGYLLTSAVAVTQYHIDLSYDVPELNNYLDFINLMTYDYHGTWEEGTGVNAPLFPQETDDPNLNLNVNHSVHVWINNGASPSKLVLGLGAYGRSFTLTSLDNTGIGAPFDGPGAIGPYTEEPGYCGYNELCEDQQNNPSAWNITEVEGNYVYANKDLFWVGYDSPNTIYAKAQYAKEMGLGGIMYWAVDLDDFSGICGDKYPLITQGIEGFRSSASVISVAKLLLIVSLFNCIVRLRFL